MPRKLKVLCPQLYEGLTMLVTTCTRCKVGWDAARGVCSVETGAEHLPREEAVPRCPIEDRCQHQLQTPNEPCLVRSRGLICESALTFAGVPNVETHPLGFNACVVASPEELAEHSNDT